MGNNASTPQSSSARTTPRPSNPNSPAIRSSSSHHDDSSKSRARKKKSVDLSDDLPTFTTVGGVSDHKDGTKRPGHVRSLSSRRKGVRELELPADLEEFDQSEGTLRGAMQGKAEHVVYGPRRENPMMLPSKVAPTSIPTSNRPVSIAMPAPTFLSPTSVAGMDPDDTVHPGFHASPRLTSDVLLSSENMPVIASPLASPLHIEESPFIPTADGPTIATTISPPPPSPLHSPLEAQASLASQAGALYSPTPLSAGALSTTSSDPFPPALAPTQTVVAPIIPLLPLLPSPDKIPSGTTILPSSRPTTPPAISTTTNNNNNILRPTTLLLPPTIFNAPVAAIPIPLLAVPSATIAASLKAAAVDVGAGNEGVPTLIKWKDEDGQGVGEDGTVIGPDEVFVTGTFANGWKMKIELRKTSAGDFSALISLPPGHHRLKFIVDKEWKASKHLQLATDADGNLINYLYVSAAPPKSILPWPSGLIEATSTTNSSGATTPAELTPIPSSSATAGTSTHPHPPSAHSKQVSQQSSGPASRNVTPTQWIMPGLDDDDPSASPSPEDPDDPSLWTSEIPQPLLEWGEWELQRENIEASPAFLAATSAAQQQALIPPPPTSSDVPPPMLPAQLEKGPLNHAAYVTMGSGDDNSILPKPDHSVINHLAASPIKGGFLSVGVTTRYKRKFVTIVYYKALATPTPGN